MCNWVQGWRAAGNLPPPHPITLPLPHTASEPGTVPGSWCVSCPSRFKTWLKTIHSFVFLLFAVEGLEKIQQLLPKLWHLFNFGIWCVTACLRDSKMMEKWDERHCSQRCTNSPAPHGFCHYSHFFIAIRWVQLLFLPVKKVLLCVKMICSILH